MGVAGPVRVAAQIQAKLRTERPVAAKLRPALAVRWTGVAVGGGAQPWQAVDGVVPAVPTITATIAVGHPGGPVAVPGAPGPALGPNGPAGLVQPVRPP